VLALLNPSRKNTKRRLPLDTKSDKKGSIGETKEKSLENMSSDSVDLSLLPPHFLTRLHSFQLEGVSFALKRGGRVLICDEMGLGLR
jgi:hypothetical protein